mgnify:FL=1
MDQAELVMVSYAATIPNQCGTMFKPRLGASSCVIDQPDSSGQPVRSFSLAPIVVVGTLDDIIADFGRRLREAHAVLKETHHITGHGPEHQTAIREVFERRPGGVDVAVIPFAP